MLNPLGSHADRHTHLGHVCNSRTGAEAHASRIVNVDHVCLCGPSIRICRRYYSRSQFGSSWQHTRSSGIVEGQRPVLDVAQVNEVYAKWVARTSKRRPSMPEHPGPPCNHLERCKSSVEGRRTYITNGALVLPSIAGKNQ